MSHGWQCLNTDDSTEKLIWFCCSVADLFLSNKLLLFFFVCLVDRSRVTLWPYTGLVGSDYINASFVDVSSHI